MKHEIIKTDNYLLVVDESEITKGNWHLANDVMITKSHLIDENCKKIIAHLPLNGSPILEGVDLLPPLEDEVDVKKKAEEFSNELKNDDDAVDFGYINGYNQCLEDNKDRKYTEEDIYKAIQYGREVHYTNDQPFIQSLSQPKIPIGFERELVNIMGKGEPITERNSQGHTQWVGTYIYE